MATSTVLTGSDGSIWFTPPGDTQGTFTAVCQVKSFSIDLSREELDSTTLPCGVPASGSQAQFRTMVSGYASGSGTMDIQFTDDNASMANQLLQASMLRDQSGAKVQLYINTVDSTDTPGTPDPDKSLYIEAPIAIMGFSVNVTPDDITTATLNFNVSGQPTKLLV